MVIAFDAHKCVPLDSSQNALRVVREATEKIGLRYLAYLFLHGHEMLVLEWSGHRLIVVPNHKGLVEIAQSCDVQRPQFTDADVLHCWVQIRIESWLTFPINPPS